MKHAPSCQPLYAPRRFRSPQRPSPPPHYGACHFTQVLGLEVPMRDLRLMDPALAAWETFAQMLVRDNALVVSAEHVRLLITCDKVRACATGGRSRAPRPQRPRPRPLLRPRPRLQPPAAPATKAHCAARARVPGHLPFGV